MQWGRKTLMGLLLSCATNIMPVYPADDSTFRFIQRQRIEEIDKASEDQFGASVAVWGDTALVGAPGDDGVGSASGAAYVFTRDADGHWQEKQKLTASIGAAGDLFGSHVALRDGIAVIGARGDGAQGSFAGAAYIFIRDESGAWNQAQKLMAGDGVAGNLFGFSVALDDQTILIGARGNEDSGDFRGAAYVFTLDSSGQWTQAQKLTANDGSVGDGFGASVALHNQTILIGARGNDDRGSAAGAAYLFTKDAGGLWRERQKLTASEGVAGDEFGSSVALGEQTAFVGARFAKGAEDRVGAVYVFVLGLSPIGTEWSEFQKLIASDDETSVEFGSSLALSRETALVGVRGESGKGAAAGAVYVFTLTPDAQGVNQWREQQKVTARDGLTGDEFGASVALFGETALIGAPFDDVFEEGEEEEGDDEESDDETFTNVGSAYVLVTTTLPDTCAMRTEYENAKCKGTFEAASLADLDDYVAKDFGREDNKGRYQNLEITASLKEAVLVIESPCEITLGRDVTLTGDFIRLDGRGGVISGNVDADKACVLSEQNGAEVGSGAVVNAGELTVQAVKGAVIGENAAVDVESALVLTSTGDTKSGIALIDEGAIVNAGSIKLEAPRRAEIGENVILTSAGSLLLLATGTASKSVARIQSGTQVQATDLTIRSLRKAQIGENATITLSGNLRVESTDSASKSRATVEKGAQVTVGGEAAIVSGNKAALGKNTAVMVTRNLHMEAVECEISSSAAVAVGSKSGNCF